MANSFVVLNELPYQSTAFQTTDRDGPTATLRRLQWTTIPQPTRPPQLLCHRRCRRAGFRADRLRAAALATAATTATGQPPLAATAALRDAHYTPFPPHASPA